MSREPAARFELAVGEIPPAAVARSFRSRLPAFGPSDLRLREQTAAEIREKDRQHLELVRRYGLARVLAFYGEELIPAAERLPAGTERWELRFRLGCRQVALAAADGADRELTEQAERLQAELPAARFADDPQADRDARQQIRAFLTDQLAGAAERLRRSRRAPEALRAYAVLDRMGAASPAQWAAHARLRWLLRDRSLEALRVYLRAREGNGVARDAVLAEIERFLEERLAVGETSSRDELSERLFLNQLALCSARPLHPAWRNAGLAYLRLGQPARALPYLDRARALNGSDGGANAYYLGQARFHAGDRAGSETVFAEAAAQGYSKVRIAAWRGLAHALIPERERALAIFEQGEADGAMERAAGELYVNWGRASFVWENVRDAQLRFEKAAAADPADPRASYGLALCWESLGEPARAAAELRQLVSRSPDFAPAVHRLGLRLEAEGDLAAAVSPFRQAVTLSPRDPEYNLSLGLALAQTGDPDALRHLESAAEAGAGGPEVLRRLALLSLRQGDRQRARRWLAALAAATSAAPAVVRLQIRELASQATEAFNLGRYPDAVALWEEVAGSQLVEVSVAERLALALAYAADGRLQAGELAGFAELVERAYPLAPGLPECRCLYAVARLLKGDGEAAGPLLRGLLQEPSARPELAPLAALAAILAGEEPLETASPELAPDPPAGYPQALAGLLRVLTAVSAGRFEEAAQRCDAWLQDPDAVRALGLPRDALNALVADVKLRGTRRKRQQGVRFLEGLNARDAAGFWAPGAVLARQALATEKGLAQAAEADLAELTACQEAYRGLFGAAPLDEATVAARQPLLAQYTRLLVYLACHHAQKGRLAAALGVVRELEALPASIPQGVRDLERILRQRLAQPSHEKAFALLAEEPETARQTWEALLAKDPQDLLARHHLACLAWSRAYDAVLAGNVEASLPFWREGLEHFRLLYGSETYWRAQLDKGRALGTSTAYPFDEGAFTAWRREALYQRASTLLHLIFHLLAGVDLAQAQRVDVVRAKALMALLRDSNLDAATRQRLAADLADHYLDPDPTQVPDFSRSRRRAETVVDIDPANVKARTFLLRSVTHEIGTRCQEGERSFPAMAKELAAMERHAEWLEGQRRELPADFQGRAATDLAAFYDQLGWVKHQEGQLVIEKYNHGRRTPAEARRLLESIQQTYRDSDRWFEKSLAVDPVNLRAKTRREEHAKEYASIQEALRKLRQI